jgi:hypothetical protein
MGADLSRGEVVDGVIHCPLHDWQFAGDGRCVRIPASPQVPPFARQRSYLTDELAGQVVFHNGTSHRQSMPFFDGVQPSQLLPAAPFELVVNTPWYMIGANAFDLQHFRIAHDRTLIDEPVVDRPAPDARRIVAIYQVSGSSFRDKLTRVFSGPTVRMSITIWNGTLILVTAAFARTTSYGMVFVRPLGPSRTHLRNIVWIPRRSGVLARLLVDPIDARIRRSFIRAFMMDDASRSDGVRYNSGTLIEADRVLRDYMDWLAQLSGPTSQHLQREP